MKPPVILTTLASIVLIACGGEVQAADAGTPDETTPPCFHTEYGCSFCVGDASDTCGNIGRYRNHATCLEDTNMTTNEETNYPTRDEVAEAIDGLEHLENIIYVTTQAIEAIDESGNMCTPIAVLIKVQEDLMKYRRSLFCAVMCDRVKAAMADEASVRNAAVTQ